MTFIQRRLNVHATSGRCKDVEAILYKGRLSDDATSGRCKDVEATLYKGHLPARLGFYKAH